MSATAILIHGIEIKKPNRSNRGAEQLLRSSADRVLAWGLQPAVTVGKVAVSVRQELGLLEYVGNPRLSNLERLLPGAATSSYCTARGLAGVLDVSGFVLGDSWGVDTARWLEKKYGLWKSISGPVVMLPQAFGPFDKVGMADAALRVLDECSNVYARDAKSRQYLTDLGTTASIGSCVDITLGVRHEKPILRTNELLLVPNWNLTRVVGRSEYLRTLVGVSRWGAERGMSVIGLLHEGLGDLELLQAVSKEVAVEIVDNESGWQVKERLARARLVVSGRYHAMLGALASGTPVAVHSWSHKYAAALEAFGVTEWQCDPSDARVSIELLEILAAGDFESDLQLRADFLADQVDEMWNEVAKVFLK